MRKTFVSRASFLAGAAAIAFAAPAHAQDAATGEGTSDQVGEIIVTAQRVEQNLQSVPVAVTVVSSADLASRKLNDLTQIGLAVPSFAVGGDNAFSIRGVGSQIFSQNIDSSVGVAVDEVSLGVPLFMSNGILDDVARIEVLSGPQGLLFGRNASAGLLNIVSRRPSLSGFEGSGGLEWDYRDTVPGGKLGVVARGMVNIPLSDVAAVRFNALYSDQDSITKRVRGAPSRYDDFQRRLAFKGKLLAEPTDRLSVYIVGDYSKETGFANTFDRTFRSFGPGSFFPGASAADGITAGPDNLLVGASGDNGRSVDTFGVSANISYELADGLTLSNIAAWRAYNLDLALDLDRSSTNIVDVNTNKARYDQYSNELRLAYSGSDKIEGQIGLYGFYSNLDVVALVKGAGGSPNPNFFGQDGAYNQTLRSLAAFGQFQYHVTDAFQLIAGARVTNDRIAIDGNQNVGTYVITVGGPKNFFFKQKYSNTNFSYKLGAQYDFTPDIMGYVTWSTGYKGPSFNNRALKDCSLPSQPCGANVTVTNMVVKPETVKNIEIGLKTTFWDRRLRVNLSAFRGDFKDFQVQSYNPAAAGFETGNAATVRSQGVDLTIVAKPVTGLTINAGATLLDSTFRSFAAACYIGQPGCAADGTISAAGLATPLSAKFTSNVQAIYEFPVSGTATAFVEGSWNHRSPINFSSNGAPLLGIGTNDTFGASLGFRLDSGFEVSIFCKNCTDQRIPTYLSFNGIDSAQALTNTVEQSFGYNSVRTFGLSTSAKF